MLNKEWEDDDEREEEEKERTGKTSHLHGDRSAFKQHQRGWAMLRQPTYGEIRFPFQIMRSAKCISVSLP